MTAGMFARMASDDAWKLAPHLALLNRKLGAVAAGRVNRLLVSIPPRHGKSELISKYFPAWLLGTFPDRRVILTSHGAEFAAEWGMKVRDLIQEFGPSYFGVNVRSDSKAADRWDLVRKRGGMNTAGVAGPIMGRGAELFIIDDPFKDWREAGSATIRENVWKWYTSTAYTRLNPGAAMVLVMSRFHTDDLAGRILAQAEVSGEKWEVVNIPAIAEDNDILGRQPGEALWPERYPIEVLRQIRATIGEYLFSAMFQGRPTPPEGLMFRVADFEFVEAVPFGSRFVRYWDKAGTKGGSGAATAGVLMAKADHEPFIVCDLVHGRWGAGEREATIKATAEQDQLRYGNVEIWVEQEPGSGGKESAENTVMNLAGFNIHAETVRGDKTLRAGPMEAQSKARNIKLLRDQPGHRWNLQFIDELSCFPLGARKDIVDASSGAFNKLALTPQVGYAVATEEAVRFAPIPASMGLAGMRMF
jgi:predicted phage terminase large subunit-like protein